MPYLILDLENKLWVWEVGRTLIWFLTPSVVVIRYREGHAAPPSKVRFYGALGKNILSAGITLFIDIIFFIV